MKKMTVLAVLALMSATVLSAQDFQSATEMAKKANEALVGGNFQEAIDSFQAAMKEAAECTEEESAALVNNCKIGIAQANYSKANDLIGGGNLSEAIEQLNTTIEAATAAGQDDIVAKSEDKINQLHQAIANSKMKAAQTATGEEKVAAFKEALEHLDILLAKDGENGKLFLQKGQILGGLNDRAAAVEAFLKAKDLGEAGAVKQLSTIFLKDASAKLKAKDFKGAIESALKSNEFQESANAYKIAGTAANGLKDLATAEKYLSKYLELAPNAKDAAQMQAAVAAIQAAQKK